MAATGQTTNYKLPMYNAGDTVSDLGSFNQAMQLIDTGMEQNRIEGQQNKGLVDALTTQVEKAQGDITALQESVTQANGNAVGALNQIQEIVNPRTAVFPVMNPSNQVGAFVYNDSIIIPPTVFIQTDSAGLGNEVTINNVKHYIAAKMDNANPFRMQPLSYLQFPAVNLNHSTSGYTIRALTITGWKVYYDGVNTYLASTDKLVPGENVTDCYTFYYHPILHNMQPKGV